MKSKIYRQGDVLIELVETLPTTATKQKRSRRIILAHGEVTGHHHALEVADPADWWKTADEKPSTTGLAGEIFLTVKTKAKVTHQEHATVDLPAGTYRVTRQREYSPEAIINVKD